MKIIFSLSKGTFVQRHLHFQRLDLSFVTFLTPPTLVMLSVCSFFDEFCKPISQHFSQCVLLSVLALNLIKHKDSTYTSPASLKYL